jgi:hypothetical protein
MDPNLHITTTVETIDEDSHFFIGYSLDDDFSRLPSNAPGNHA